MPALLQLEMTAAHSCSLDFCAFASMPLPIGENHEHERRGSRYSDCKKREEGPARRFSRNRAGSNVTEPCAET